MKIRTPRTVLRPTQFSFSLHSVPLTMMPVAWHITAFLCHYVFYYVTLCKGYDPFPNPWIFHRIRCVLTKVIMILVYSQSAQSTNSTYFWLEISIEKHCNLIFQSALFSASCMFSYLTGSLYLDCVLESMNEVENVQEKNYWNHMFNFLLIIWLHVWQRIDKMYRRPP